MPKRYELLYGFVHCRGKTVYSAGSTESRAEAQDWLEKHREVPSKMKAPPEDPIRHCKAICPFKRQEPWFDIMEIS